MGICCRQIFSHLFFVEPAPSDTQLNWISRSFCFGFTFSIPSGCVHLLDKHYQHYHFHSLCPETKIFSILFAFLVIIFSRTLSLTWGGKRGWKNVSTKIIRSFPISKYYNEARGKASTMDLPFSVSQTRGHCVSIPVGLFYHGPLLSKIRVTF